MEVWERKFPLHVLTWKNKHLILDKLFIDYQKDHKKKPDTELKDIRGRTPLHLAVTLGHKAVAEVLLRHGASVTTQNAQYWTVLQEAVSSGRVDLVQLCLKYYRRGSGSKKIDVPTLLTKLRQSPDFYVEMKWEFTSWVPMMSRLCPNDTYKIWKRGSNVRVDTTLLGFEGINWQRGNHSYLFKTTDDNASVIDLDHDSNQAWIRRIDLITDELDDDAEENDIDEPLVNKKLHTPLTNTYLDTELISFVRDKSGIYGFRQDKSESVNGYNAKVFNAMNVSLVTKTRTEHLTVEDKSRLATAKDENSKGKKALDTILSVAEKEEKQCSVKKTNQHQTSTSRSGTTGGVSIEEYFDPSVTLDLRRNIGNNLEQTTKTRSFSAHIWLAETYPLLLQEQLLPVIQLMSQTNQHFKRLHDFIVLQLPSGFPVKIEIPLFHILSARITFGNIFGMDREVPGVKVSLQQASTRPKSRTNSETKNSSQSPAMDRAVNSPPAANKMPDSGMVDIPLSSDENSDCPNEVEDENTVLKPKCSVRESLFDVPNTYSIIGDQQDSLFNQNNDDDMVYDQDEELLQFAIRQSLLESGQNPASLGNGIGINSEEDRMLQRAIQASLSNQDPLEDESTLYQVIPEQRYNTTSSDQQMMEVIEASRLQQERDERNRLDDDLKEEKILQEILKLSLQDM